MKKYDSQWWHKMTNNAKWKNYLINLKFTKICFPPSYSKDDELWIPQMQPDLVRKIYDSTLNITTSRWINEFDLLFIIFGSVNETSRFSDKIDYDASITKIKEQISAWIKSG